MAGCSLCYDNVRTIDRFLDNFSETCIWAVQRLSSKMSLVKKYLKSWGRSCVVIGLELQIHSSVSISHYEFSLLFQRFQLFIPSFRQWSRISAFYDYTVVFRIFQTHPPHKYEPHRYKYFLTKPLCRLFSCVRRVVQTLVSAKLRPNHFIIYRRVITIV